MHPFFQELGRTVLGRWKERNFSLEQFPEIAAAALVERPPAENVDLAALIRHFLLEDAQPFQTQSGFGQPELVVFDDPRFYIQVLFWLEGATDIHQHEFSGAFHVMEGSSIHAEFEFTNARPVSAHFRTGDLRMKGIQLLEKGSTEAIRSGRDYIHSLFHLDMPSVSVVLRTHHDPGSGPQFTYLPPHVALDPQLNDALTARRKQLLDVLEQTGDPTYPALVREMAAELDFERGFFILQNGMNYLRHLGEWEETLGTFQAKHGALADCIPSTLDEIIRRDGLVSLRNSITEPEHRFFLALLLNVPSRAEILAMVARRFPGPPEETIARWALELAEPGERSTWILDAEFPNLPGVDPGEQLSLFIAGLLHLLKAKPGSAGRLKSAQLKVFREAFTRSSFHVLVNA